MLKLKNFILLIFLVTLVSCGEYNRVLNKGSVSEKYKLATELYEAKKFSKALRLFEMITVSYKGKPQMERIQYMVARSYFNTGDYPNAAYYFQRFTLNYPKSSKREESEFIGAKCHYLASPKYSVDQTETKEALIAFQKFINRYPDSKYLPESNEMVSQLQYKLETKAFEIAKQYYEIGYFSSAVTAFDNMTSEYLGTVYREQAFYYKLKASYELAIRSTYQKKMMRLEAAEKAYQKLKRNYPESKYLKESDGLVKRIREEKAILIS